MRILPTIIVNKMSSRKGGNRSRLQMILMLLPKMFSILQIEKGITKSLLEHFFPTFLFLTTLFSGKTSRMKLSRSLPKLGQSGYYPGWPTCLRWLAKKKTPFLSSKAELLLSTNSMLFGAMPLMINDNNYSWWKFQRRSIIPWIERHEIVCLYSSLIL